MAAEQQTGFQITPNIEIDEKRFFYVMASALENLCYPYTSPNLTNPPSYNYSCVISYSYSYVISYSYSYSYIILINIVRWLHLKLMIQIPSFFSPLINLSAVIHLVQKNRQVKSGPRRKRHKFA